MTATKKKGLSSGNCEAQTIHHPERNRIINIVYPDIETVAVNVRYGLARRGHHDASCLAPLINVPAGRARDLYSGRLYYTPRELAVLAAHFGVTPDDLLDENLIVDVHSPDLDRAQQ